LDGTTAAMVVATTGFFFADFGFFGSRPFLF
jgi:hypothetical protein